MDMYGSPGGYAAGLATRFRLHTFGAVLVAVSAGAGCWAVTVAGLSAPPAVPVLLAVLAGLAALLAERWWRRAGRAAVGAGAERLTVSALRRARFDGVVFCGLMIGGGGDADLVCVRRDGRVFVGEVKTVKGRLSVDGDRLLSNGRALSRQPGPQVRRQVAALRRAGVSACPFIVASQARMSASPMQVGGVAVVTADGLPDWLAAVPGVAPGGDAVAVLTTFARDQGMPRRGGQRRYLRR